MSITRVALAIFVLSAACSSLTGEARRESWLREELDRHEFSQPLTRIWPLAMRVVVDHRFQLVGRDRVVVGEQEQSAWKRVTGGGFQTRRMGEHGLVLESRENASRVRVRLEGTDTGGGRCRATFTAIRRTGDAPSEERSRDVDLELELIRLVEPDEALRIRRAADIAAQ